MYKMPPYSSPLPQKMVALNSRACSLVPLMGVVLILKKSNFAFEKGTPSPPAAELPPRKEPLQDDPLRVAALIDLWLLHCYKTPPTLVGGHSVHPRFL